ncbi:MAG: hypothetical protein JO061_13650, partial [Acidobacteriaceae bacterium]|nr:hypothetical protein [Acidobacteriaceae bacterium]
MAEEPVNGRAAEDDSEFGQAELLEPGQSGAASFAQTGSPGTAAIVSDTPEEEEQSRRLPFNVVGLGASAGGIEAFVELFQRLPDNTGMAYVAVAHLSADQKSHLREILARHTKMAVHEIENGMAVEPNCVFVIPPKAVLTLERGVFQLDSLESHDRQRTIDLFFYSLASDQKNRAIGVVLSGMDSDGALGLRAIKGEGGITMVQAPETAQYPEMPQHSISADHVDIVSSPVAIAAQLAELGHQSRDTALRLLEAGALAPGEDQQFSRIIGLMRGVSGVDFRLYKPTTIRHRIARRMLLNRIDTLKDYMSFLQANPGEVRELHEDALINVT